LFQNSVPSRPQSGLGSPSQADTAIQSGSDVASGDKNASGSTTNESGVDTRPMAVVIETQMTANLVPLMLHFGTVLGPGWGMILFTLKETWVVPPAPAFKRALDDGRIQVRFLPEGTAFTDSRSVSKFLSGPWLWRQVKDARRILMFQTDSMICSKAPRTIDEFLEWDFVGAPIDERYGKGYNGGFSLRNPALFLEITETVDWEATGAIWEDQWFYQQLEKKNAKLPNVEVAKPFAVETIYFDEPIGYHQVWRFQEEKMGQIEEYCPEVKLMGERRAT
jgi:hypothetical protein